MKRSHETTQGNEQAFCRVLRRSIVYARSVLLPVSMAVEKTGFQTRVFLQGF